MIVEAVWSAQIYSETCLHELGDKYYSSNRVAAVSVAKGERERERERKREREREREREKERERERERERNRGKSSKGSTSRKWFILLLVCFAVCCGNSSSFPFTSELQYLL